MKLLHCLWSSEEAYTSVHKVADSFAAAIEPDTQAHLFLLGSATTNLPTKNNIFLESSKRDTKKIIARYLLRKKYAHYLSEYSPDVLILDGIGIARVVLPILEKIQRPLKVLVYFHGETSFKKKDIALFNKCFLNSLELIAVSQTLKKSIRTYLPSATVHTIPTYLNLPKAISLSRQTQHYTLGAIGRLSKSKNFSILVDVARLLISQGVAIKLLIAGDGDEMSNLEEMLVAYNLQDHIKLLGHLEGASLIDFYTSLDLLLIPSLEEGQGLVIQEALHYNCPVICSNLDVFIEQLSDSGVYCPPNDVACWRTAISKLFRDNQLPRLLNEQQLVYQSYNNAELFSKRCISAVS